MRIILIIISLYIVGDILHSVFLFTRTQKLVLAQPYSRTLPGATMRILVLGDSTAVGTGSEKPEETTAGRLGALYPNADVVNLAVNGLKLDGLLRILETVDQSERYDLVLIQIGANDIIRLTPEKKIESEIKTVLERVKKMSNKIIVMHSGDVGEAAFFPLFIRPLHSKRSYEVREIYKRVGPVYGAQYVDIIGSTIAKTIESDPKRYYASDGLHLSGEGYGLWFKEISAHL